MNDPHFQDRTTYASTVPMEDEDKKLKLSYLAQDMMESDDRRLLLTEVTDTDVYNNWTASDAGMTAMMATDLAVGQLGSGAGGAVGSAVFAAGLILGEINDGSMNYVGQAFLPENMYGEVLDTPEKAQEALITFTRNQIQKMAGDLSWEYECAYGCDTWNQIFILTPKEPLNEGYIYKPEKVIVKTMIYEPEAVSPLDPVSAMIGFPVRWKTKQGNQYVVSFFSKPYFDENNKLIIREYDKVPHMYPAVDHVLEGNRLGRDLRRMFHSTPYTITGNQAELPKPFYFNGEIYAFRSNSDTRMVDRIVTEKPLLTLQPKS